MSICATAAGAKGKISMVAVFVTNATADSSLLDKVIAGIARVSDDAASRAKT